MAELVHFTIGEDLGITLMTIAQEHLTESYNPQKAINTILESLQGCSMEMALQILKGDIVLVVDVAEQNIIPIDRIPKAHDNIFPKIDFLYFMKSHADNVMKNGQDIIDGLKSIQEQIAKDNGYFNIDFKYEDIFKFIAGDNDVILNELRDNIEIDRIASIFRITKLFIEDVVKIQSTMKWIMNSYELNNSDYQSYYTYITDTLNDITYYLNQTLKLEFNFDDSDDDIKNFINSTRAIDEALSEGIKPVDILSNYSAGWLAPNGDYYALNGEIANMLHNQIATALYEAGIIPEGEDNEGNPDGWLEQNGWVKIHDNNVQFAGCLNVRLGKRNVDLTPIQIKKIYEYCALCHNGLVKAGWRLERVSAIAFKDIAEANLEGLYKKYFEF